jgi:hypothetical protein
VTSSPRADGQPSTLTVGGYTLLTRLGEGGMGVVHLAQRPGGPRVALKVLRPHIVGDDEARARLAREVGSLRRVRSRWVAEILDADPYGDIPYVATRYVPGLSLHDHVQEEGPITGEDLWFFAEQLAEGLADVHDVGVLHRDVKPSNVLMEGRTPILIDFGLARVADDPKLTHTGWLLGTPGYLAPEVLFGDDATEQTDVHSWAATVAFAGTGRSPFGRGPAMAIMDRVRRGEHDLSGLPADLLDILEAALDPDPLRRPDLETVLDWLDDPDSFEPAGQDEDLPRHDDELTIPLAVASAGRLPTEVFGEDSDRSDTALLSQALPAPRTSPAERLRRALLTAAAAVATTAALATVPYPTLAGLLLAAWLLRSGSLAASAAGSRRELRGIRWYDAPQLLLASPWHVLQAIPGVLVLALWSAGLAAACALVCYAGHATAQVTLAASGLVFLVSLWVGPGGSRFRGPVGRMVVPLSRGLGPWAAAVVLLLAGGGALVALHGGSVDWSPFGRPFP